MRQVRSVQCVGKEISHIFICQNVSQLIQWELMGQMNLDLHKVVLEHNSCINQRLCVLLA